MHKSTGRLALIRSSLTCVAAAAALMLGSSASAQSQPSKYDLHVLRVFTEGQSTAGFFTVENISADCLWGLMYVDLSTPSGRGRLALLMQAKAQGLKLQRVDFVKNASGYTSGTCLATGVHVE